MLSYAISGTSNFDLEGEVRPNNFRHQQSENYNHDTVLAYF